MGEVIDMSAAFAGDPDIDEMDLDSLVEFLGEVQARIEALDELEPEEMDSDEYEEWADRHEELEDLEDELLDRIDEMS